MLTINNFLFNAQIDNINLFKVKLFLVAFTLQTAKLCVNGLLSFSFSCRSTLRRA